VPSSRGPVVFRDALRFWVKLGFISFGGPAGQIAIMHRELVERRRWIGEQRFLHALNFCMLLPGPEAQQLAIYVGWLLHRTPGGLAAGLLFVLPSVFILLGLSWAYAAFGSLPAVAAVLDGMKPVVVAIVVEAVLRIGGRALHRPVHHGIAALAFAAIFFLHVPFPWIVLAAALVGVAGARLLPGAFEAPGVSAARAQSSAGAALADDAAPPPHSLPSRRRELRVVCVGALLWAVPLLVLVLARGWTSLHAQLYRFFTAVAFVTFGGAYAVLAYVTQAAVTRFGWLTPGQAVDGLALAETTPGPLIMVLQFVGFMAGWQRPEGLSPEASALLAALVTTWATFLPCFVFVFLGGPYVEALRGSRTLTAALSGITAAVVGVVLNLAVVFGIAVVWPGGLAGGANLFAAVVAALAFLALQRLHVDVLPVVLAGGAVGLARALASG
jgi:chromate transporter